MFAVVSPGRNCAEELMYGTDYHSHLGTAYGGMMVSGDELVKRIHAIGVNQFKAAFLPDLRNMRGPMGIGVVSPKDKQPIVPRSINHRLGSFAICTYGQIENAQELVEELEGDGVEFEYDTDRKGNRTINITKVAGLLISRGETIVDGIEEMWDKIVGDISLLVLNTEGIYAARSEFGHSALYLGEKEGAWAVTVETTAFPNLGFRVVKPLLPGEIIFLDLKGPRVRHNGGGRSSFCTFNYIYTYFPATEYGGVSAQTYKERVGASQAQADISAGLKPRFVTGIADSGTGYAVGYAAGTLAVARNKTEKLLADLVAGRLSPSEYAVQGRNILDSIASYCVPLLKYTPGHGRSYIFTEQEDRDRTAKMKLVPVRDILEKIIEILKVIYILVVTEDSIVRRTQLENYFRQLEYILRELWGLSMPPIYIRVGCPPLAWPCPFTQSTRAKEELATRKAVLALEGRDLSDEEMREYLKPESEKYRQMVAWIAKGIPGVVDIRYATLPEVIEATGQPTESLCTYCWTGEGL